MFRGAIKAKGMVIGRFDNVPIVPRIGGDIGEGLIAVHHGAGGCGAPQDAVDHHDGFRTGDILVRPERAVRVAIDQAGLRSLIDVLSGPVPGNIGEVVQHGIAGRSAEAGKDGRQFRTGDISVRAKGTVLIAGDHAQVCQSGYRRGVPRAGGHVLKAVDVGAVGGLGLCRQEPVQDHRNLRAGDVGVGRGLCAGASGNVGDMVLPVEQE